MPSNYTQNYQLSQWEAADQVKREDFNADNAKIDDALAQIPKIVLGTYSGTSPDSPTQSIPQTIHLGFQPKAVFVAANSGLASDNNGAFFTREKASTSMVGCHAEITSTGFIVRTLWSKNYLVFPSLNHAGMTYQYLAIG